MVKNYKKLRLQSGFSMIELLVVISIIGIIVSIASPNFLNWLPNMYLKSATRDLYGNFQKARLEAIKRNAPVALSFSSDPANTYEIFVDDGGAGGVGSSNLTRDAGEAVLATFEMPDGVKLNAAAFNGNPATGFDGRGYPFAPGNQPNSGDVILQNSNSRYSRVSMLVTGNIRMEKSTDGISWN